MTETIAATLLRGGFRILGKTPLASRVAETLFTTPRRFATPDREKAAMAEATPLRIRFEDLTLHAWRWGAGPAVLLVHGWEGRGSQMTPFVHPLLEQGMSVVTFDGPAHGSSGGARTTLPQFTAAVRAVAESAGPIRGVIGHSFGCAATTLALHDGLEIERAIFIAPPVDAATYTRRFGEFFGLNDEVVEGMKQRIERRFHRKWTDFSVQKMATKMKIPLLVIHDRDDEEIRVTEAETVVRCWPSSRLLVTSGLGHRRILRDPSVARAAADFMRE